MTDISTTDTAKLVRKGLKAAFPAFAFSVVSKKYSGGSSITATWTDGPTEKQVEAVAGHFEGSCMNLQEDLKESNGQPYANDFIFFNRHNSDEALKAAMNWYTERYGNADQITFRPTTTTGKWTVSAEVITSNYEIAQTIYRHMHEAQA